MRKQTLEKIAELRKEVDPMWAKEARREYLKGVCTSKIIETWENLAKYEYFKDNNVTALFIIYGAKVQDNIKDLLKIKGEFVAMNTNKQSNITPDMIARAREYPFRDLHQFNRQGWCKCPFHEDKTPSMKLYSDNRVHCYSCGKSWDTIDFIKRLEELSFPEAVRRLQ